MSNVGRRPSDPRGIFSAPAIAEGYDEWYDEPWERYADAVERKLLLRLLRPRCDETVLDVGCGTGRYLRWLRGLGLLALGVDISEPMLGASRRADRTSPAAAVADGAHLPFAHASFDVAIAVSVLEFLREPWALLVEMRRVARRGLFLGVLNQRSLWAKTLCRQDHPILRHARLYTPEGLADLLRAAMPGARLRLRTTLLATPSARPLGQAFARLVDAMPWAWRLPWGAYIGVAVDLAGGPGCDGATSGS
jgi:SAM-dependent methyltransferase